MTEQKLATPTQAKPMTREERALANLKAAKAAVRLIEQEKNKGKRKQETRGKIMLGAMVLSRPDLLADLLQSDQTKKTESDRQFIRQTFGV